MALAQSDAKAAVTYANDWIFGGDGGVPAGHCKALGLLAQGEALAAANLLEKLVDDMVINGDSNPAARLKNAALRVRIYGQAALAWKEAGELDRSYMAYSSALSGIGAGIGRNQHFNTAALYHELYLMRGTLQILRGQYRAAIEDLTRAIKKDEQQFEGFLQRAKAYRKRRSYLEARLDLKVALILKPDQPEVLLESGILYRKTDKKSEARQVWQEIIDRYPQSEYAPLAQTNIDLLKVE